MIRKIITTAAFALGLGACSNAQISAVETGVTNVQTALNSACADVASAEAVVNATPLGAMPQAQVIEGYASGACVAGVATADIVAKEVSDPTTLAWIENLAAQLKALKV